MQFKSVNEWNLFNFWILISFFQRISFIILHGSPIFFFFSSPSHPLKNDVFISHCFFIISRLVNFVSRRWTRGMAREFVQIFSVHCFERPKSYYLIFRFLSNNQVAASGVWFSYLYLLSILKIQREYQDFFDNISNEYNYVNIREQYKFANTEGNLHTMTSTFLYIYCLQ